MDIIGRNILRLIRCGAFNIMDDLELMNNFKWIKLIHLSESKGCPGIVYDGMIKYYDAKHLSLDEKVKAEWQKVIEKTEKRISEMSNCIADMSVILSEQNHFYPILIQGVYLSMLYLNPLHYYSEKVQWWTPLKENADKMDEWAEKQDKVVSDANPNRLLYYYRNVLVENSHDVVEFRSNKLTKTFNEIIKREISHLKPSIMHINATKVEILPATAMIMMLIMNNIKHFMYDEVSIQQLLDIGMLLRKHGDKVDYVKLEGWLEELNMQEMANIIGGMLITMFDFTQDEIPFMKKYDAIQCKNAAIQIFNTNKKNYNEFDIKDRMEKSVKNFVGSTSKIKYHPHEILGGYLQQIKKMFSEIEE
ncbi:MAG: nucleotidyltransferase family protein [Prevotella sp.]|nr:nucleotidyltransferase family protein [Candidatus Equicola stercoris]